MAVIVNKYTKHTLVMKVASDVYRQKTHRSRTTDIPYVAARDWLTRSNNRSVAARQRYNITLLKRRKKGVFLDDNDDDDDELYSCVNVFS